MNQLYQEKAKGDNERFIGMSSGSHEWIVALVREEIADQAIFILRRLNARTENRRQQSHGNASMIHRPRQVNYTRVQCNEKLVLMCQLEW